MENYQTIQLEKNMYMTGKPFSSVLEERDPSEKYQGTTLESLDAYQRQLKRFGIRVAGMYSDPIEKFFQTSDSAALFPEYVSRAVHQGIEAEDVLSKIIATKTQINSLDYRSVSSLPTDDAKELKEVAEGELIPETEITVNENLVKLKKRGRMLVASYEALRYQKLDLFTVMLRQIGAYISRWQLRDALEVLSKDSEIISVKEAGKLTYQDLISFWNSFDPYTLTTIVVSPQMAESILALPEMRDAAAGLTFHGSGKMVTPLGAELIKSAYVKENQIIGLDRSCALEMVEASGVATEYDKLIDRQLERAAITVIAGFSPIVKQAAKILQI